LVPQASMAKRSHDLGPHQRSSVERSHPRPPHANTAEVLPSCVISVAAQLDVFIRSINLLKWTLLSKMLLKLLAFVVAWGSANE
jgi:hypothetical protein